MATMEPIPGDQKKRVVSLPNHLAGVTGEPTLFPVLLLRFGHRGLPLWPRTPVCCPTIVPEPGRNLTSYAG